MSQVDREKVLKHGREAAGKLLVELQVRKSTADGAGARAFYTELTTPLPGWDGEIRDLVLKKKQVSGLSRGTEQCPADCDGLAAQALLATQHFRRGRQGRAEGLPSDSRGHHRELRRARSVMHAESKMIYSNITLYDYNSIFNNAE